MSHCYSVQVPDDLHDAIEDDMANLSAQMQTKLTPSQYLRLVINARLQRAEPLPTGVEEGMRMGLARFMRRMQEVMTEIAAETEAEVSAAGG